MIDVLLIDSSVVTQSTQQQFAELSAVIAQFASLNINIAIVSTKERDLQSARTRLSELPISLYLSGEGALGSQASKFKGGPQRIDYAATTLGTSANKILYVGDDRSDYTSAMNAGCFFLLANWIQKNRGGKFSSQAISSPGSIWYFASHFLIHAPRWEYTINEGRHKLKLRSLITANTSYGSVANLACDPPRRTFTVRQAIKDHLQITAGGRQASEILIWHAISSAKLEGLFKPKTIVTIYPSSSPGQFNPTLQRFIQLGIKAFGSRFSQDLLVRAVQAPKSHILRQQGGRPDIYNQANTVHLHPQYAQSVRDKTVVVFDDFHTAGNSTEWARNLLLAAGAEEVVFITLGKFGGASSYHNIYIPKTSTVLRPLEQTVYVPGSFTMISTPFITSQSGPQIIRQSFARFTARLPYH